MSSAFIVAVVATIESGVSTVGDIGRHGRKMNQSKKRGGTRRMIILLLLLLLFVGEGSFVRSSTVVALLWTAYYFIFA